jgi:hypothetical protein
MLPVRELEVGSRGHMKAAAEPYRQYSAPPVSRFLELKYVSILHETRDINK